MNIGVILSEVVERVFSGAKSHFQSQSGVHVKSVGVQSQVDPFSHMFAKLAAEVFSGAELEGVGVPGYGLKHGHGGEQVPWTRESGNSTGSLVVGVGSLGGQWIVLVPLSKSFPRGGELDESGVQNATGAKAQVVEPSVDGDKASPGRDQVQTGGRWKARKGRENRDRV